MKKRDDLAEMLLLAEVATDTTLGHRIYAVVAETVQAPVGLDLEGGGERLFRPPESVTVRQPYGRVVAQVAHAVSLVRLAMAWRVLQAGNRISAKFNDEGMELWTELSKPITTVVLAARDSYELHHVHRLLERVPWAHVQAFYDENTEAYGPGKVMTAIATEPVTPKAMAGIIDYLPLWTPKEK